MDAIQQERLRIVLRPSLKVKNIEDMPGSLYATSVSTKSGIILWLDFAGCVRGAKHTFSFSPLIFFLYIRLYAYYKYTRLSIKGLRMYLNNVDKLTLESL